MASAAAVLKALRLLNSSFYFVNVFWWRSFLWAMVRRHSSHLHATGRARAEDEGPGSSDSGSSMLVDNWERHQRLLCSNTHFGYDIEMLKRLEYSKLSASARPRRTRQRLIGEGARLGMREAAARQNLEGGIGGVDWWGGWLKACVVIVACLRSFACWLVFSRVLAFSRVMRISARRCHRRSRFSFVTIFLISWSWNVPG